MSFLSPLFLAGAAAALIPIALHLFFRRAEPVIDFAAIRFLRRAPVEHARRRRLREWLLLLLRVTAMLLLAFAFARPYFAQSAAALSAPATMVLIDTSMSMGAPGVFERARALAEAAVRRAPPTHAVGVLSFANTADVVVPPAADRARALAALATLEPGAGATRYGSALARAIEAIGPRPGRIVMITDLQQSGWAAADEGSVPGRIDVDVEDAGTRGSNVAIASLRLDGPDAVALVRNFSDRPRDEQVIFSVDDRRVAIVPVAVPSQGTIDARASVAGRSSGVLAAAIVDSDGYTADNIRYSVLDTVTAPEVVMVSATGQTSDTLYLERALAVADQPHGFRHRLVSGRAFSTLTPELVANCAVLVVLATRGLEHHGRDLLSDYVRRGGAALLTAGPDVDVRVLREALAGAIPSIGPARETREALHFAPADARHPIFESFGASGHGALGNVTFSRTVPIEPAETARVIARFIDGTPALVEQRVGQGRVVIFASDLNNRWNDFPLQPSFVPFVYETLRYLAAVPGGPAEYFVGDLGALGVKPGVVSLRRSVESQGRRVAVNVDPRESDPARVTAEEFRRRLGRLTSHASPGAGERADDREEQQRLWQYALVLMIVGLAAESVLGRRLG